MDPSRYDGRKPEPPYPTDFCHWTVSGNRWETSCGEALEFQGPKFFNFEHCPYCAKTLTWDR